MEKAKRTTNIGVRSTQRVRRNSTYPAPSDLLMLERARTRDYGGTLVTPLQKQVPVGLLARCLPSEIARARNGFWASDNELVVTFRDRALVCHPATVAQLGCLLQEMELAGAVAGWLVEDQQDFHVWLELADDEVRILHPPAQAVAAALKLLSVD